MHGFASCGTLVVDDVDVVELARSTFDGVGTVMLGHAQLQYSVLMLL